MTGHGYGLSGGGRFLVTAAVSRYPRGPDLDRPELAEDVIRIAGLLTRDFGYTHIPIGAASPTYAQLRDGLRAFCQAPERRPDDLVVVYLACHGAILDPGEFVLLPSDIDPGDLLPLAVTPRALAEWLVRETKVQRLLIMLDTCYSGQGGQEAAQAAVRWVNQPGATDRAGLVVLTATHPWQMARPGAFSRAFERAVNHLASGGYAQEDLPLDAVAEVMKSDEDMPASQTVTCHYLGLTGRPPPFLPNPRYRRLLIDVDLLEQERARHAEQRTGQLRDRFVPATRWFTGRHAALRDITHWLNTPTTSCPALVVTGSAGSGKTALLGLLAALSDSDYQPTVPRDGLPSGLDVREDVITEAIYAGTMTTSQVRDRIATAAGCHAETTGDLIEGLRHRSDDPLIVLIDAIDEAGDPSGLVTGLLNPLIRGSPGALRLLLGTRPHLLTTALLGKPGQGRYQAVDLDSGEYADPASMRAYIRRILLSSDSLDSAYRPAGLYQAAPAALLDRATEAIGDAAGTSFLVARITATTEATVTQLPDPTDPSWCQGLPKQAGEAMRRDLDLRLGEDAGKAAQLLLPLAYAQGGGLPWENIWPSLANALSPGRGYGNEQLIWLRKAAGSYAVEGRADGRSVYRLYHQALTDYLLQSRVQYADQHVITQTLASLVPHGDHHARDWANAHPYIRAHLATHAGRAGTIDTLLTDPGYLLAASVPQLLAAADKASTPPARTAADAYRRAAATCARRRQPSMPPTSSWPPAAGEPPSSPMPWINTDHQAPGHPAGLPGSSPLLIGPSPATPGGVGGGGGGAGRPPRGRLRRRRPDGAGVGPGHRRPGRRPVHRPHRVRCARWRWRSWTAAPWSSPAATTGRCGCGTWPPAPRSATRSPATAGRWTRWRRRSWTAGPWSSPAATTGRCGCGTWPPAPRSATRSPATPTR